MVENIFLSTINTTPSAKLLFHELLVSPEKLWHFPKISPVIRPWNLAITARVPGIVQHLCNVGHDSVQLLRQRPEGVLPWNLWKLQIQKWSEIVLNHKTFRAQICLDGMDNEWTHTFLGHWNLMINARSATLNETPNDSPLATQFWSHKLWNLEVWKGSGTEIVGYLWLFQIHPNSDSVHPILRNNKLPSCQVPNYQRVDQQFQQNNVRNLHCCDAPHLSSGPKAEELRPCSSEIPNWHPRYARSKLANLPHNCDIALISVFSFCFKALRYGEIHGDQKMAPLLSRKSKVMAPSTKGNTVSTPWTKKSASFKKANPTDQSSWLVFDRAIWQYHSSALSVELLTF